MEPTFNSYRYADQEHREMMEKTVDRRAHQHAHQTRPDHLGRAPRLRAHSHVHTGHLTRPATPPGWPARRRAIVRRHACARQVARRRPPPADRHRHVGGHYRRIRTDKPASRHLEHRARRGCRRRESRLPRTLRGVVSIQRTMASRLTPIRAVGGSRQMRKAGRASASPSMPLSAPDVDAV